MDTSRKGIDSSTHASARSRRVLTRWLGGGVVAAGALGGLRATAKKKKKKATLCLNGQTITTASKKKRKSLVKSGATSGACPPPGPPACTTNAECGAGAICAGGACQTCTVTCGGTGADCGVALQQRLNAGGTVYVCPGRYAGRFVAGTVSVFGAGAGDAPATNTILDAESLGRTLSLNAGVTTVLTGLRITGGAGGASSTGGGIYGQRADLTINSCAITGNRASVEGGAQLSINRSEISRNTAYSGGGGVLVYISPSKLILDSATRIVNNTVTRTDQDRGGGILTMYGAVATRNGATINGNTPDDFNNVA